MKMTTGRMWASQDPAYKVPVMKIVIGDPPPEPDMSLRDVDLADPKSVAAKTLRQPHPGIIVIITPTIPATPATRPAAIGGTPMLRWVPGIASRVWALTTAMHPAAAPPP